MSRCYLKKHMYLTSKYNLKPSLVQYIYPISYKIAKKGQTLSNVFALFEKRYHTIFTDVICAFL